VTSWLGLPVSAVFQDGVNTILKCCEENDVRKLLSDIRFQEQISNEDELFADRAICRHAERHGPLHQAIVLSNEVFLKFNASDFDRCLEEKCHVKQFFSNEKEAVAWLLEVDFK
jgi:hypothetical protein